MWEELLAVLGSGVVLLAAAGWLVRSLIVHYLSKDVEAYKIKLEERIEKARLEHEVRFRNLHDRQAEILAELYGKLVDALRATSSFVSLVEWRWEPSKEQKYVTSMEHMVDLFNFFDRHRLFLSGRLCQDIENFLEKVREPTLQFALLVNSSAKDDVDANQKLTTWVNAWKAVTKNEVPQARSTLEREFRALLGVEN